MIASDLALKFVETRGGDSEIRTFLQIENQSDSPMLHGWRLYFSLGLTPCDNTYLKQVLVDGRYGYLEPTDAWNPLAPRTSARFQVENWLFSGMRLVTRQGFFLVAVDENGKEQFLGEPTCLAPELEPLTEVRNNSILAMTPGVRTVENPPPPHDDTEQTIIPRPKFIDLDDRWTPVSKLETNIEIEPTLADSYQVEINESQINIKARTEADSEHAAQSLQQLALKGRGTQLPTGVIRDNPDFEHRALFIDIARHFHDIEQLKKVISAMVVYKMNRLQLGISNDEGWRLEISELPQLIEIGATRSRHGPLFPSWGDGPDAVTGHLTREDFIELIQFANERHISIIPEFNLPGHANALLRAHDESDTWILADPEDASTYRSAQGYRKNVVNVGLIDTYRFAETIISAVRSMYDEAGVALTHLHLGGDEVPPGAWLHSPACRKLQVWDSTWNMDDPTDQKTATAALMSYHYNQMLDIVERVSPETRTGFWHEMAPYGDNRSYYNVWLTDEGDRAALDHILQNNFQFVISNASHLYLDMPYTLAAHEPGLPWANYIDTEDVYHFDPLGTWKLDRTANVMGIQAQLWSETVFSPDLMDYYLFPRLLAVAERGWNQNPTNEGWASFYYTIQQRELDRLRSMNIHPRKS